MSVSNVSNNQVNTTYNTTNTAASQTAATEAASKTDTKAVEEKSKDNAAAVYEKSDQKKADSKKTSSTADIQRMIDESNQKVNAMKEMLRGLVSAQADKDAKSKGISRNSALKSLYKGIQNGENVNIEIPDDVRAKAAEEVSEDGYYGVKKTSERILDFAKALVDASGGDPKMIDKMEKAVKAGFDQAAKMWGGDKGSMDKMPQITRDTYDAVMKGFSDWKESLGISGK